MAKQETNFIKKPTKTQMIVIAALWFIGALLLVLATSDLFRESMLQQKYIMTNLLLIGSTVAFGCALISYLKNRGNKKSPNAGSQN